MRIAAAPAQPPRAREGTNWADVAAAGLLAVTTLTVYVRTLYPGLTLHGDSPKFQYLGSVLGTAHPPGYPLYILISYCFSKLSLGTMAFRMNLLTAVCATIAVVLTYAVLIRLRCHRVVALAAALCLAFGRFFWGRALEAEVYGLASALMALVILLVIRWAETGRDRDLYLTIFAFGLSLGNHLVLAATAPALVTFVLLTRPASIRLRTILIGAAAGLAGFLPYLYIVIRSVQQAPYVEARATSLPELVDVILARRFSGYMFSFTAHDVLTEHLPQVWTMAVTELGLIGLAFAGIGLTVAAVQRRTVAVLLATGVAGIVLLTVEVFAETDGFLMPAWVLLWMLVGLGMQAVWSAARARGAAGAMLAGAALLAVPGVELARNYRTNDHHRYTVAIRYFAALFRQLPDRSAIVSEYYNMDQAIRYKIAADGAASGRTIEPIPNDRATVERFAKAGYEVFAFASARASLGALGFGFEPVQLYEAGASGGQAATPIDMTDRAVFRLVRRVPCDAVGNLGWRDVTDAARDGQLLVRVDNYRPFDSTVVIYAGGVDAATVPALIASTGPQRPDFSVVTFRLDRQDEKQKSQLLAALARDGVTETARILAQPVVRRLEWRVNDQGQFSQSAVALAGSTEVAIARATVDLNNPLRATLCGWPGEQFFVNRAREDVALTPDGDRLFGQGWSDAEPAGADSFLRRITQDDAEVIVPLARTGRIMVRVRARTTASAPAGETSLVLTVNGVPLAPHAVASDWQIQQWDVPAARWNKGFNRVTIGGRHAMVSVSGLSFEIEPGGQPDGQPGGHVR